MKSKIKSFAAFTLSIFFVLVAACFTTCSNSSSSSSSDEPVSQESQPQQTQPQQTQPQTTPQVAGCSSNNDCPEGTICNSNGICVQAPNTPACEDGESMCVDNGTEAWRCINGEWNIVECVYGCAIHSNGNAACADAS